MPRADDFLAILADLGYPPIGGGVMADEVTMENCDSCGAEASATDLISIKLGSQMFENLKICDECSKCSNPEVNFEEAAELVVMTKFVKGAGGF